MCGRGHAVCSYGFVRVCMWHTPVCMRMWMRVSVSVCLCDWANVCVRSWARSCYFSASLSSLLTHMTPRMHTHVRTHTPPHAHTKQANKQTHTHTHTHTEAHAHAQTKNTRAHTQLLALAGVFPRTYADDLLAAPSPQWVHEQVRSARLDSDRYLSASLGFEESNASGGQIRRI